MIQSFVKFHGTGNDFILIDNRKGDFSLTRAQIAELCHRRFGIGADGLLLLNSHPDYDFQMINYNSDGGECTMCGNGGRTLVQFASDLGIKKDHYRFLAVDGEHEAYLKNGKVELKMQDVKGFTETPVGTSLDTGSPHLVVKVSGLLDYDIVSQGRKLRNSTLFLPAGINVNFTESRDDLLFVRTYERGVEDETLSCGTGAIASAIVSSLSDTKPGMKREVNLQSPGGKLTIRFERKSETEFQNIWLIGETKRVFHGTKELQSS
jgi:diaminopimelate epimerase